MPPCIRMVQNSETSGDICVTHHCSGSNSTSITTHFELGIHLLQSWAKTPRTGSLLDLLKLF